MKKILVMGAGHGGQALAADLALRGHEVRLFEHPDFKETVQALNARNCTIELENKLTGTARLACVTTDPAVAMQGVELIYFAAPSYAQQAFWDLTLPYFEDGQIIILTPGNFGTFSLKHALGKLGKHVLVGEMDNLPYACVATEPGRVTVRGIKKMLGLAVLPGTDYEAVDKALQGAFCASWKKMDNVLQSSMSGMNMVLHCLPMLMNCGRIENDSRGFGFYGEGMSGSICSAMELFDQERLAVAKAFGLTLSTTLDMVRTQYNVEGQDLYSVIQANPAYVTGKADAPTTIHHRFLTEDVPFSLLPTVELGRVAGVPMPVMEATLTLCTLILGEKHGKCGQSLEKMGLTGKSAEDILNIL